MSITKKVALVVAVILVLLGLSQLPLKQYMNTIIVWFQGAGIWGPLLYLALVTVASATVFPFFMMSIGAGIIFGMVEGAIIMSLGNLFQCILFFLAARYTGRSWFESKFEKYKIVKNMTRAIEAEGWRMLFMLRVVPIAHMLLLNVVCGLSKLKASHYIIGTWLGMLPLALFYVYIGTVTNSVIGSVREVEFSGSQNTVILTVASAVFVAFVFYMKKVASKYAIFKTT